MNSGKKIKEKKIVTNQRNKEVVSMLILVVQSFSTREKQYHEE